LLNCGLPGSIQHRALQPSSILFTPTVRKMEISYPRQDGEFKQDG
jgi:hypothetical protein